MDKTYLYLNDYINNYNNISPLKFDSLTSTKFNFFASIDTFDFDALDKNIKEIERLIPYIKQIFIHPIIHLTEESEVLPIEMARNISNKSISYLSSHTSTWNNIKNNKVRPKKILTKTYQDNYSIYENIVFAYTIEQILSYVKHNLHVLNDIIYSNNKLEIDLLEHTNHENYYVALGKLQSGYIRLFSKYAKLSISLIKRLEEINNILTTRLNKRVYRLNKGKTSNLKLHTSNILLMDKNYSKIYKFIKNFEIQKKDKTEETYKENYFYFVKYLLLFAIINFNFESSDNIDIDNLNLNFKYKCYELNMKSIGDNILLTFQNDTIYKILIKENATKKEFNYYDEEINVSDIENSNNLFISVNNIDSFRRLQQILLKGMIYSTRNFKICPFCGDILETKETNHICQNCFTVIKENNIDGELIYSTSINTKNKFIDLIQEQKDPFIRSRLIERQMYFRNITRLNSMGEAILKEKN